MCFNLKSCNYRVLFSWWNVHEPRFLHSLFREPKKPWRLIRDEIRAREAEWQKDKGKHSKVVNYHYSTIIIVLRRQK